MKLIYLILLSFFILTVHAEPVVFCDVSKGLDLINQETFSPSQIDMILTACDQISPNSPSVLLLHGLFARLKGQQDKQYTQAIQWLEKARAAAPQDLSIRLELATTYKMANQLANASQLYQQILSQDPQNRAALLGQAGILRLESQFNTAAIIYQNLLKNSPHDVDALNGMGWVKTAEKDLISATQFFQETLKIQPENQEALLALNKIKQTQSQQWGPNQLCNVSKGLILLNQAHSPFTEIKNILNICTLNKIDNTETQLLQGLLARKEAQTDKNYNDAFFWLKKAMQSAPKNDYAPALELALTYEWSEQLTNASLIYRNILNEDPENRAALLGQARVYRLEKKYSSALNIYQALLKKNPKDTDAFNGLGWLKFAENNYQAAIEYFRNTLAIQPLNKEAVIALSQIREAQLRPLSPTSACKINEGLKLLNQKAPPLDDIESIIKLCEQEKPQGSEVALLRGLLARYEAQRSKNYDDAISWLQKAMRSAEPKNFTPALELGVTYEWANQPKKAQIVYDQVLTQDKNNRAALLGEGRVLRRLSLFEQASLVYEQLLVKNQQDIDAINGLGWVEFAKNNLKQATQFFENSLKIQPKNEEAALALKQISETMRQQQLAAISKAPVLCEADQGLILLNQPNPPIAQIEAILARCDRYTTNQTSNLMLHGLLARYEAKKNNKYKTAITWLKFAMETAEPGNLMPAMELAVTYEWAQVPRKALVIYQQILAKKPDDRAALFGEARALRSLFQVRDAMMIYQQMLRKSPTDTEALNGLGETLITNYELKKARQVLSESLALNPYNNQTLTDLKTLDKTTKNILGLTKGHYVVPPRSSDGINLFYFRNLNATDGFTLFATHNTAQIESNFAAGPSLLPNNSLLLGYQHIIPNQYGWQLSYDGRQHNGLPYESRIFGSTNVFVLRNLQWFGGLRVDFPRPWKTQLVVSGLTVVTPLPVNITVTGFWAFQQIGGYNSSYSLDFSKEVNNRFFYDIGPSYLEQQKSWEVHGRLIFPIFKNQALVAEGSHYFFNRSTYLTGGWRIYWQ
ncbi:MULTISPECIES: tetratricopeptide repeat protein [Legionella]|uniref:Protein with TPR motifs (Protein-protein interaction motif) n=1 Tax=Legionella drozanskii LLAP-1 TaxID=1212489 RepID=A0A0W0TBJ8_9GAMM|nr:MULTISPECIES: tetratricopeptide repeat protein [Legionella]KTC92937.1 protein with TPR motifs (protein-protein interaction motif) [Legionella drozanskii LLAP-1]PJE13121.1 MAG: hypothetical protein CK430_06650 [Legionella sp.]